MKIDELFIGALVFVDGMPAKVTGISSDGIVDTTICRNSNVEQIMPIPLTNKILYANGFNYHHKNYASLEYPSEDTFTLADLGEGIWCVCKTWYIRNVHELQTALRVFNVDKAIDYNYFES